MAPRARSVLALGAGVGAGLAIARLAGRRRAAGGDAVPAVGHVRHTSLAERSARIAATATRAGGGWATDQARKVFADAERREAIDEARQLKTA
ncbi:MAG: hypothetical protein KDA94_13065, partial [Acidimicrobiales bacterium]|nr:hypothetical protein [Acidimicrobiales bacterium]